MTRTEFIKAYVKRSGLPEDAARFAEIGRLRVGDWTQFAMPCGCGDETCEGWAMVGDDVLEHLFFNAPSDLRDAYRKAVEDAGGK